MVCALPLEKSTVYGVVPSTNPPVALNSKLVNTSAAATVTAGPSQTPDGPEAAGGGGGGGGGVVGGGGGGGLVATGALPPPPPQEAIIDPRPRATMNAMVKESQAGRDVSCVFIMLLPIFDRKVHGF